MLNCRLEVFEGQALKTCIVQLTGQCNALSLRWSRNVLLLQMGHELMKEADILSTPLLIDYSDPFVFNRKYI